MSADGIRKYDSERQSERAARVAGLLDELLLAGRDIERIEELLKQEEENLAAVCARMLRFPRLYYCDLLAHFRKETFWLLCRTLACVPSCCGDIFKNRSRLTPDELTQFIDDFCSPDEGVWKAASYWLKKERWLFGRVLQEDVFERCSPSARMALLENGFEYIAPVLRRAFLTQVMASGRFTREEKVLAYRSFQPYDENLPTRPTSKLQIEASLLGRRAVVNVGHDGLSRAYSKIGWRGDYHLAVCTPMQQVYAESLYVRYHYVKNRLPGYRLVRSSFYKLCGDAYAPVGSDFETAAEGDNPGSFRLTCDLEGITLTLSRLVWLIQEYSFSILDYLVRDCPEAIEPLMSWNELVLYLSAHAPWDIAQTLVAVIEEVHPGTVAASLDPFGNNALWYTLYDDSARDRDEKHDKFIRLLEACGCDRHRQNHLSISYADLVS